MQGNDYKTDHLNQTFCDYKIHVFSVAMTVYYMSSISPISDFSLTQTQGESSRKLGAVLYYPTVNTIESMS